MNGLEQLAQMLGGALAALPSQSLWDEVRSIQERYELTPVAADENDSPMARDCAEILMAYTAAKYGEFLAEHKADEYPTEESRIDKVWDGLDELFADEDGLFLCSNILKYEEANVGSLSTPNEAARGYYIGIDREQKILDPKGCIWPTRYDDSPASGWDNWLKKRDEDMRVEEYLKRIPRKK